MYTFLMSINSNIIAISGKQYSGKDTFASFMLEYLKNYSRIGIGDAIKLELAARKNLPVEEIYQNKHLYRKELIELGNWGRAQDSNFWLQKLMNFDNIIVPDLRVIHELEFFKSKGAILIRIESNVDVRKTRGQIIGSSDITETGLDNYKNWDYIIENNSDLESLKIKAKEISEVILRKNC